MSAIKFNSAAMTAMKNSFEGYKEDLLAGAIFIDERIENLQTCWDSDSGKVLRTKYDVVHGILMQMFGYLEDACTALDQAIKENDAGEVSNTAAVSAAIDTFTSVNGL